MNLLGAMNREYSRSKHWSLASLVLAAAFTVCSLVGSLGSSERAKWVAGSAFVIQVTIVECRRRSGAHYRLAEVVRRPAVLLAGLNRQPAEIEIRRIAARLRVSEADNRLEAQTYYASNAPPGPRRLIEIIEESSFWTADLAESMANFLDGAIFVAIFLLFIASYAALETGRTASFSDAAGKILLVVATVCFAGDTTQLKSKYHELAEAAKHITDQCTVVKSKPASELLREAMILTDEYNCALASAPIIPEIMYSLRRDRLNSAWSAKCDLASSKP